MSDITRYPAINTVLTEWADGLKRSSAALPTQPLVQWLCFSSYGFQSTWRVNKANEPVSSPAFIVEFWTDRIQLSPSRSQHDAIFGNAAAY